jgi:acyl homoserine lactone synthase
MSLNIQIRARREFCTEEIYSMHRLRAKVFKDRMGWEVPMIADMEIDGYDALEPLYMIIKDSEGGVCGCWRALPTSGPYMLKDSFSQLLHGKPAPISKTIWELSRFAIETGNKDNFGFTTMTLESISEMMAYGMQMGIEQYVTVTTTAIERLLRRSGAVISRVGPPVVIGVENAVALFLDVKETYKALSATLEAA